MPKWRVRINLDVELTIDAEKSADAESSALSRLIKDILNRGVVDIIDPRAFDTKEIFVDENKFPRHGDS